MTMRIGFDASKIMPPRDGIGTYTTSLLNALVDVADEHELHLYPSLHPIDHATVEPLLSGRSSRVSMAKSPFPTTGEVDVFHATSWIRPPAFDGPVLMTCYDLTVISHPDAHRLANRVHCLEGLLDAALAGDRFLTLSVATAEELQRHLEISADRIAVVPAAVDERFQPQKDDHVEEVLASFGIASPYVLTVGTREPRKNLGRLLDAWSRLEDRIERVPPLVVVGAVGWATDEERSRLESTPGVHLIGHVADAALPALYSAAAVFAYPSLAEGFGFPVLEAMACGTPVVTSSVSSLPEVAGDAAILVDPLDTEALTAALARVLGDPQEAARLRRVAKERAATFSWPATARSVLGVYASMVRPSGEGA